jgi:glucose-6-phosphate isomerase
MEIDTPQTFFDSATGVLWGEAVSGSRRYIKELKEIFHDAKSWERMDGDTPVYAVEIHEPVKNITGGLLFGISRIFPGKVGNEYFMTKGHFHVLRDRAEYYWGIAGKGVLLCMDSSRQTRAFEVKPGSLHYIPGNIAHRLINTGNKELTVGACWPSDAGHDYESILKGGFAARIIEKDGQPLVIRA